MRQSQRKDMLILEYQLEIAQPCSEAQNMWGCHDLLEIHRLARLIHEGQAMDKWGTTAIGVHTWLQLRQAFRQSHQQSAAFRHLIDQQARPTIAERDAGDIDPIPEVIEKR
jgi:hypothetical protein